MPRVSQPSSNNILRRVAVAHLPAVDLAIAGAGEEIGRVAGSGDGPLIENLMAGDVGRQRRRAKV